MTNDNDSAHLDALQRIERLKMIESALESIDDLLALGETVVIEPGSVRAQQIANVLHSTRAVTRLSSR